MGIRDAISQVPSKPGFVIALVVALGIGAWYYGTSWQRCSTLKQGRDELSAALATAANSSARRFSFSTLQDMENIKTVRIARGHKPGKNPLHCPFGWDMTWRERQKLIEAGNYTIIGLFDGADRFQRYIEWRETDASFEKVPKKISVDTPLTVAKPLSEGAALTLSGQKE